MPKKKRMAGRLVDLTAPSVRIPWRLVLDSGVVIDWLASAYLLGPTATPLTTAQIRAAWLVRRLVEERVAGLITSTSAVEIFHYVLKIGYRTRLPNHRADLLLRYPNVRRHGWEHLFKARSDIVKQVAGTLDQVRQLVIANDLIFLQPEDLGPIPSGRTLDGELIHTMERYELDSSDAAILIEAARAGVVAIVTADADLRRAQRDFDVYTWF